MTDEPETPEIPEVEVPAPVVWPLVLALGVTLLAASLVTQVAMAVAGLLLVVLGAAGWVRELLPDEGQFLEPLTAPPPLPVEPRPGTTEKIRPDLPGYRMQLPEQMHPYSAGVKGGLAGAVAMAIVAVAYGIVSGYGPWYPINLLAGMVIDLPTDSAGNLDIAAISRFNLGWLLLAILIHGVASMSVGLVYGVVLPTLPQQRFLWGGIVAPLLWTGGLYAFLGVLNPVLRQQVDWPSFILAQFAYGIAVDIVVMRSEKIHLGPVGRAPEAGEATP